jgi:uncharacterized membrane protein
MKCSKLAFYAQGSRIFIIILHVGAVKIYVTTKVLRKKERQDEIQLNQKN